MMDSGNMFWSELFPGLERKPVPEIKSFFFVLLHRSQHDRFFILFYCFAVSMITHGSGACSPGPIDGL